MSRTIAVLIAVLALAAPAAASTQSDVSSALRQERYYMGTAGEPAAAATPVPAPAAAPAPPAPADDAPWKVLAIGAGLLALVLAGAEVVTLSRLRRATAA
jgi:hypothetical protein